MREKPELRLVDDLAALSPGLTAALVEHRADNEEILPHLFFGDVARYAVRLHQEVGISATAAPELAAILVLLEDRFAHGSAAEENLIAVSFLENLPDPGEPGDSLRYALGPTLTRHLRLIWPTDTRLSSS
jgi:hypothetical protein